MDKDRVLLALTKSSDEIDHEKAKFITENLRNKSSEEVAEYLMTLSPEETGGITAISGFYYQFLVTIEYLIELMDGIWDYLAIELHDDIIVGKGNKIRFIQVKTSEKLTQEATQVSDIYRRKAKIFSGNEVRVNNSWVDKLLSKAQIFKNQDGYETQFQLYTSYHVIRTSHYNFDHYTDNKNFNKDVPQDDDLLEKLSEKVYDRNGQIYDYSVQCGEQLEELLKRFYLKTGQQLTELRKFENHLCVELGQRIFKDYSEVITISLNDLYFLTGYLTTKCTVNSDQLILTLEDIRPVLDEIRERVLRDGSEDFGRHGNKQVSERVFDWLHSKLNEFPLADVLSPRIYEYQDYFSGWLDKEGNLRDLINRYIDGTTRSQVYTLLKDHTREEKLRDFFFMILILNVVHNRTLNFAKCKSLLTKNQSEQLISFLSLSESYDLEKGKEKLKTIFENIEIDDIEVFSGNLKIIFQQYRDRRFTSVERVELVNNDISVEGLPNEPRINRVSTIFEIIPGKEIEEVFYELLRKEEQEELVNGINQFWSELLEGK